MARESGSTGVLFYGMSGGGKTACALELAYQYQDIDRFQHFMWFEAPKGDSDISGALIGFARQWDIQVDVPEVPLVTIAGADDAKFAANLPRLSRFLEQRSVLIVMDNLESLLRENGQWRDPRWEKLIAALVNHRGQSRVVLTSRIRPQPHDSRVLELPVHSLTLQEAALLARQSPNLGASAARSESSGTGDSYVESGAGTSGTVEVGGGAGGESGGTGRALGKSGGGRDGWRAGVGGVFPDG